MSYDLLSQIRGGAELPRHIAIIMDGNGRWARRRGQPRLFGHRAGMDSVRDVVEATAELGIPVLTLYAFSQENWLRPRSEVNALMALLRKYALLESEELRAKGIRVQVLGRLEGVSARAREALESTMECTREGKRMILNLAISYGGRQEIVDAAQRIAEAARRGQLAPDAIDEETVARHLYTAGLPDPDLLIRTSGEMRLSNFLLWQMAYTEIYVTDVLWPDFRREHLYAALLDFQGRERRFGKVAPRGG